MKEEKTTTKFSLSGTFKEAKAYVDTRMKLFQLQLTERSSRLIASIMVDGVKVVLVLFIVFYLSLALGFYLSELLGSTSLGFLATGGIFVLLFLIVRLVEPKLERKLMNLSIRRFLEKWTDEDDENAKQTNGVNHEEESQN